VEVGYTANILEEHGAFNFIKLHILLSRIPTYIDRIIEDDEYEC
jgi:hypothetical protein